MTSLPKRNYSKLKFTIVYYTSKLWYYGTLIYYKKNYGTIEKNYDSMDKTMYYTENYGTLIYEEKKTMVDYQKLWETLIYNGKIYGNLPK